jgi:hypothetical protein
MTTTSLARGGAALAFVLASPPASAADKQKCMDAAPRGQDLRDQGKLVEAIREFTVCADSGCPDPVPTYCAAWLDEVKKRIPSVLVRVTDPSGRDVLDAAVTIDDRPVAVDGRAIDLDPGPHRARASRPGWREAVETVVLLEGERDHRVTLRLETERVERRTAIGTSAAEPARPIPLASWITWGIGAAGLVGFTAFGIKANVDYGDYRSSCGNLCARSATTDVERTMVIADVSLAVGVVGALVGTVFYFTSPRPAEGPQGR